ncbi:homoserine kinase, partial [Quercus suber]
PPTYPNPNSNLYSPRSKPSVLPPWPTSPSFDFLGYAVDGFRDFVSLSVDSSVCPGEITITQVSSDAAGKLSCDPHSNYAGIIAIKNPIGRTFILTRKGLPLDSGLGSSAVVPPLEQFSSTNCSAGSSGRRSWYSLELKSEEKVSDYHTDNVGPVIMGGFVLIRNYEPLDLKKLNFREKKDLYFVLVSPEFKAPTMKMRATLPLEIGMADFAVALAAAVLEGDVAGLGKALSGDRIVEPRQAPLILGMEVVKKVAIEAGAFGCTISGARPTAVAMIDCEERGEDCGEDGGGVLEKRGIKGGGGSESA